MALSKTQRTQLEKRLQDERARTAKLLESLGHRVEPAGVDLTGLGLLFRVMAEAESAAIDVSDPAGFSDDYSRWCYEKGSKLMATEYVRATEEMSCVLCRSLAQRYVRANNSTSQRIIMHTDQRRTLHTDMAPPLTATPNDSGFRTGLTVAELLLEYLKLL